jgi:hypothetical protein
MSAQEAHGAHRSPTHADARVHCLERVLHGYGPLTRDRLHEFSGADHWVTGPSFDAVLGEALRAGRVRSLGGVLLTAADPD